MTTPPRRGISARGKRCSNVLMVARGLCGATMPIIEPAASGRNWGERLAAYVRQPKGLATWLLALTILAASILLRAALAPYVAATPLLLFFPALITAALFCGWREALLVLTLSAIAAWQFFLPHAGPGGRLGTASLIRMAGFVIVGLVQIGLVSILVGLIRRLDRLTRLQHTLYQELQHRVANNMQIVAGILQQARRQMPNEASAAIIDRASARITAMARLHRRLNDLSSYSAGLAPILRETLEECFRDLPVELRLVVQEDGLTEGQITTLILLVHEAALNAVKHVFSQGRGSAFEVALTSLGGPRRLLLLRDDGPGFAAMPENPQNGQHLGMSLLRAFAEQLGGELMLADGPGATLRVEFSAG